MAINLHDCGTDFKKILASGFSTGRLLLKVMTADEREMLLYLLDQPEMLKYLPALSDHRDTVAWLEFVLGKRNYLFFTAMHRETRHIVAFIFINRTPENRLYIGGAVARSHWGNGYAQEILKGLRQFLESVSFPEPLYAEVLSNNTAVIKALSHAGFSKTRVSREALLFTLPVQR